MSRYRLMKDRHTTLICVYAVGCPCLKGRGDLNILVGVTKSEAIKCSDSSTLWGKVCSNPNKEEGLKKVRKKSWIIIANGTDN